MNMQKDCDRWARRRLRIIVSRAALVLGVVGLVFVVAIQSVSALTINRNFTGGAAPGNAVGGGNLVSIFNTAANFWQSAILDPHTVTINFSWAPLPVLGRHNLLTQGGTPNRETSARIRFDNDGTSVWFVDPTPTTSGEYTTFTSSSANLGGGVINTGLVFTGATGLASGRTDLLSVAIHEIGHALGLSSANTSFQAENVDLDIDVTAPRPFPGTVIPTVSGAHLNLSTALMFPTFGTGIRRLGSAVDILANCQISQFNNCNLAAGVPVPEPTTLALLGIGLAGLAFFGRRGFGRRRKSA